MVWVRARIWVIAKVVVRARLSKMLGLVYVLDWGYIKIRNMVVIKVSEMSRLSVDIYSYTKVCSVNNLMSITQQFNETVTLPIVRNVTSSPTSYLVLYQVL